MPYAAVIFEEPQFAYDVAKEYKEHVDSVRRDRSLEEFLEARLVKLIITHISNPFVLKYDCHKNMCLIHLASAPDTSLHHSLSLGKIGTSGVGILDVNAW